VRYAKKLSKLAQHVQLIIISSIANFAININVLIAVNNVINVKIIIVIININAIYAIKLLRKILV
jgi:hypothetical protein